MQRYSLLLIFMFLASICYAGNGNDSPSWAEPMKTVLALLTAAVGLAFTIIKIRSTKPGGEKTHLEIEKLKLEIKEKKITLGISDDNAEKYINKGSDKQNILFVQNGEHVFPKVAIAASAIALPFILIFGMFLFYSSKEILSSMGQYYYTGMRDIYVGIHIMIAVILFSYRGYERTDNYITKIQGVFCILIALCPTQANPILATLHYVSAIVFFLLQSYVTLFIFTKSSKRPTPMKLLRNNIFRICGITIFAAICLIILSSLLSNIIVFEKNDLNPIFWLETLIYFAFGISWFVKGQYMFKDRIMFNG